MSALRKNDRPVVLIDCDPGIDDAVALLVACRTLHVEAVTTVCGNVSVEQATANALRILELAEAGAPVAAGMSRPWLAPPRFAPYSHGSLGLGNIPWDPPRGTPVADHAVDVIIDTVRANPGITVIALGPLTNVATALRRDPHIVPLIDRLLLMGGSTTHGNVTPTAEFNMYGDPEAARAVFSSGLSITMVGLNVTEQVTFRHQHVEQLRALGTRVATVVADMIDSQIQIMMDSFGLAASVVHDPVALAPLLAPHCIELQPTTVAVETTGEHTRGMTVCDFRSEKPKEAVEGFYPVKVATDIDAPRYVQFIIDTIATYA